MRILTQGQIDCLEEIGFKWKLRQDKTTFEQRCRDLEAFKSEFGHCDVTQNNSAVPSLAIWCSNIRTAYKKIQQGQTPKGNLTQDGIDCLEEIGFK